MIQGILPKNLAGVSLAETPQINQELQIFLTLPLTEEYQSKIRFFITDFAHKNPIQLLGDRKGIEERKAELATVHTLRHIAFLFSEPDLNQSLKVLRKSEIRWAMFVNGMGQSINRKKESGTLNEYIPGFSAFLKAENKLIQSFIDQNDYKGMFDYLLKL